MRSFSAVLALSLALLASAHDRRATHGLSRDAILAKEQSALQKDLASVSAALASHSQQATHLRAVIKEARGTPTRQKPYKRQLGNVKRAMATESAKITADHAALSKVVASRSALAASTTTKGRITTTKKAVVTTSSKPKTTSKASTTTKQSTTSTSSVSKATGTTTSLKKGLGYNTASFTNAFGNSLAWAYNWADKLDPKTGNLLPNVQYIPMLWGASSNGFSAAASTAIKSGATFVLGFNEPDLKEQSNLNATYAAKLWKENMEPLRSDTVRLVSPAITNGGAPSGVAWMADFIEACTGCHIDAIAAHWYDSATNLGYFHNYFTDMAKQFGRPIWITEFAGSGSVAQQQTFFADVIPWMEKQTFIQRYAAFGDFAGTFVNSDGSLTPLGTTYKNTV